MSLGKLHIISGPRQSGKTTELIKLSNLSWSPIAVHNNEAKKMVLSTAAKLGLSIPTPITYTDVYAGKLLGTGQKILVDNMEIFIDYLLKAECGTELLGFSTDDGTTPSSGHLNGPYNYGTKLTSPNKSKTTNSVNYLYTEMPNTNKVVIHGDLEVHGEIKTVPQVSYSKSTDNQYVTTTTSQQWAESKNEICTCKCGCHDKKEQKVSVVDKYEEYKAVPTINWEWLIDISKKISVQLYRPDTKSTRTCYFKDVKDSTSYAVHHVNLGYTVDVVNHKNDVHTYYKIRGTKYRTYYARTMDKAIEIAKHIQSENPTWDAMITELTFDNSSQKIKKTISRYDTHEGKLVKYNPITSFPYSVNNTRIESVIDDFRGI